MELISSYCIQWLLTSSRSSTSGGSSSGSGGSTSTSREDKGLNATVLQQTGEKGGPVRSNGVVGGIEEGLDVVSSDFSLTVIEGEGSERGDEFVLRKQTKIQVRIVLLVSQ